MMPRLRQAARPPRIAISIDDASAASDMAQVLEARGFAVEPMPIERAMDMGELAARVVAYAPEQIPGPELAARIAPMCQRSAEAGRPIVMLSAASRERGQRAWLRAASLAYLRSFGTIVCRDPDAWLETICLIAGYALPSGPRVAIVAPEGSLIRASAIALANEVELIGDRLPTISNSTSRVEPVDVALVDHSALSPSSPERVGQAIIVPVLARAELLGGDSRVPLVGLRAALTAVDAAGRLALQLETGLGPAPTTHDDQDLLDELDPDIERFERQVDKLGTRAGDHEAKVMLSSWGIPVTRQAVATTPSAATRVAKKAGYPVEVKPWGPDQLSERDGCPVQTDLHTAADVRRAVAQVTRAAGLPDDAPVIVRETPPPGRQVSARVTRVGPLGWMVRLMADGMLDPVVAPAPLRPTDAYALTQAVEATRKGDRAPDREALADILTRASHLAVHHERAIEALYLHTIIITDKSDKSVVVDAQVALVPVE